MKRAAHCLQDTEVVIDEDDARARRTHEWISDGIGAETRVSFDRASHNNCRPCRNSKLSMASRSRSKRSAPNSSLNDGDSDLNLSRAARSCLSSSAQSSSSCAVSAFELPPGLEPVASNSACRFK